jgi:hypothetical protein
VRLPCDRIRRRVCDGAEYKSAPGVARWPPTEEGCRRSALTAGCADADAPLPCGRAARRRRRRDTRDAVDPGRFSYDRRGEPPSGSPRLWMCALPRVIATTGSRPSSSRPTAPALSDAKTGRRPPRRSAPSQRRAAPREDPPRWAHAVEPGLTHVQQDDVRGRRGRRPPHRGGPSRRRRRRCPARGPKLHRSGSGEPDDVRGCGAGAFVPKDGSAQRAARRSARARLTGGITSAMCRGRCG